MPLVTIAGEQRDRDTLLAEHRANGQSMTQIRLIKMAQHLVLTRVSLSVPTPVGANGANSAMSQHVWCQVSHLNGLNGPNGPKPKHVSNPA